MKLFLYFCLIAFLLSCSKEPQTLNVQINVIDDSDSSFTIRYYNGEKFLVRSCKYHFSTYYQLPIGSTYKDSISIDRIVDNLHIYYN